MGILWCFCLRAFGGHISAFQSVKIWNLTSLGRYIPGKIWVVAGRIAMAKSDLCSITAISCSIYLETVMLCLSSFFWAALLIGLGVYNLPIYLRNTSIIVIPFLILFDSKAK